MTTSIRDMREAKLLSQDKVAAEAGVTYSVFVRIENNAGKTTADEVQNMLSVLQGMESGTRKLAGRPFKNPEVRARVAAARAAGESVSAALGTAEPVGFTGVDETDLTVIEDDIFSTEDPEDEPDLLESGTETVAQRKARLARERRAAKKLL